MTSDRWDKGNGSLRKCRIGRGRCTSAFGAIGLGALLASGCATSHTYQLMTVAVRDKLTHEPVANAFVHFWSDVARESAARAVGLDQSR